MGMTEPNKDCDSKFYANTLEYDCLCADNSSLIPRAKKFKELLSGYNIYIPGLAYTELSGVDCRDMIPQGICIASGYLLVSAYCGDNNSHKSVIYVVNESTGAFVKTMILPDYAHVGGIAFDGTYLWVCGGANKEISAYTFSICLNLILNWNKGFDYVNIEQAKKASFVLDTATSFCTFYGQRLWVGNFIEPGSGKEAEIYGYHFISYQDILVLDGSPSGKIKIKSMDRVQGINFIKYNGTVYMTLSRSYIRDIGAKNYISEIRIFKSSSYESINVDTDWYRTMTLPPMVEGIVSASPYGYIVFESAANRYCNGTDGGKKCEYPNNRICRVNTFGFFV